MRTQRNSSHQGKFLGAPYDWRKPTAARYRSRLWNGDDRRMFPPKALGWGWTINFYWLLHPLRYLRQRFAGKAKS